MKYISFSLWGDKQLYNVGAIRNAELVSEIYPDWKMILYYNNTVPFETIKCLENLNVMLVDMTNEIIFPSMWRFLVLDEINCEYAIFRDCDSRLSFREKDAVNEWVNSEKILHVMRDHPAHGIPFGYSNRGILAGMWGMKGKIINIKVEILAFCSNHIDKYGADQLFLGDIYERFINNRCTHDDFFEKKPFPTKRENSRFIGERINIDETPLTDDYKFL